MITKFMLDAMHPAAEEEYNIPGTFRGVTRGEKGHNSQSPK